MSTQREEATNIEENMVLSQDLGIGALAGILRGIQTSLADLAAASRTQTAAFETLHEDFLLQDDTGDENNESDGSSRTVDPTRVVSDLLDSSSDGATQSSQERSDTELKSDLLNSLTQAFISSEKKSSAIATKIADLIDSVLSGKLSAETAKKHGEKYFPPRTVDLAFQRVQETLIQGLSSLALLADQLAKNARSKTPLDTIAILHHVMDSLVLVAQANWSLNMKRRELIKPDLESPFTRLCKPDIAPTTKLFGDELSKQLKEMTDVSRAGKQLQKKAPEQKRHFQKPYDRPRYTHQKRLNNDNRKSFLGYKRATFQPGMWHKKNSQKNH